MLKYLPEQASALTVSVERVLPDSWPSATVPGEAHCHIFQTREFIEAWFASYGAEPRFSAYFVTVRDAGGEPVLMLPLSIERRKGVNVLSFIDQGQADYNAPILFDAAPAWSEEGVRALWSAILARLPRVDVVLLEKMPERVGTLVNPLGLLADGVDVASAHGNRLNWSWAEVEKGLNSPKEIRKKERQLARALAPGELVIAETPEQRDRLIAALVEQKQRRYEETRVPGFAENPASLVFLKTATEVFARSGNLSLSALTVGDDVAAVQWGLVYDKTFYALWTSFAEGQLASFSCGRILNYHLIKGAHEQQLDYFDQGFGDEPYKLINTDTTVVLHRAEMGVTPAGKLFLAVRNLRAGLGATPLGLRLRALKWVVLRAIGRKGADPQG